MIRDADYKSCVETGLLIMQEQRKKLINDCLNLSPTIYLGLHSSESKNLRELYFQSYITEWLSMHWEIMNKIIESQSDYSKDAQKRMTLFYADYFASFLTEYSNSSISAKLMIPDGLNVQLEQLREMIRYNDKWQLNSNRMRVQMKKSKEQYERLIKEFEAKQKKESV
ncbi:hypothetical protein [Ruminococcus albus]|uniref:hypothetical protein n=1 Tax=Ruminococcus albus TaxID=1264 RepID=UPI0005647F33|nr:hypothetical protein [Ruminococcus albus]MCC3351640.1 hypothetical protein [Ruminococcus albus 8]